MDNLKDDMAKMNIPSINANPDESMDDAVNRLVKEHWAYIEKVLTGGNPFNSKNLSNTLNMASIKFHYQSAFAHGFGHGVEFERNKKHASPTAIKDPKTAIKDPNE